MHFVAWIGARWSSPFQPNELIADCTGGLMDREGVSVAWDADGYRGENWIALNQWTEEMAKKVCIDDLGTPVIDKPDDFSISNQSIVLPREVDSLNVPVGDSAQGYSIGDYLNAVDAVTCYFQAQRQQRDIDLAAALRMYADNIEPDGRE